MKENHKYMIHACKDREWYVLEYLVPSMLEQGIADEDILIWLDSEGAGNLKSFVNSCKWIRDNCSPDESIWHLQDDVVISGRFAEETQKHYPGFAVGFCNDEFDGERTNAIGKTAAVYMWFSFQCILIPNRIAGEFATWFEETCVPKGMFTEFVSTGKCDDSLFREYTLIFETDMPSANIYPNIVDHIDYLIGGSVINQQREGDRRISYWRDDALDKAVEELERVLDAKGYGVIRQHTTL